MDSEKITEVKFKQIHVPSGKVEILSHSEKETANYRRALHGANTEDIKKQLVWLIDFWNRKIPEVWRYELVE